jgi:hypothetical protein
MPFLRQLSPASAQIVRVETGSRAGVSWTRRHTAASNALRARGSRAQRASTGPENHRDVHRLVRPVRSAESTPQWAPIAIRSPLSPDGQLAKTTVYFEGWRRGGRKRTPSRNATRATRLLGCSRARQRRGHRHPGTVSKGTPMEVGRVANAVSGGVLCRVGPSRAEPGPPSPPPRRALLAPAPAAARRGRSTRARRRRRQGTRECEGRPGSGR